MRKKEATARLHLDLIDGELRGTRRASLRKGEHTPDRADDDSLQPILGRTAFAHAAWRGEAVVRPHR